MCNISIDDNLILIVRLKLKSMGPDEIRGLIPPHPTQLKKKSQVIRTILIDLHLTEYSQIYTNHLCYTEEQQLAISKIYETGSQTSFTFEQDSEKEQENAIQILQNLGLNREKRSSLEFPYSIRWSTKSSKNGNKKWERTLFQW